MQHGLRLFWIALLVFVASSCDRSDVPKSQHSSTDTGASSASDTDQKAVEKEPPPSVALATFQQRILPIFQSAKPSSCAECHLSGVDLKEYIRPTQQETFTSLVAAGMIDVKSPDDSKILRFINRQPEKPNLITEKVRKQEYEAFRSWIQAAVNDPKLLADKGKPEPIGPQLPEEVIRHARNDRVLASFVENIWTEVGALCGVSFT